MQCHQPPRRAIVRDLKGRAQTPAARQRIVARLHLRKMQLVLVRHFSCAIETYAVQVSAYAHYGRG